MTPQPRPAAQPTAEADDAYYRDVIHEYIEHGRDIALHLRGRIEAHDAPADIAPLVDRFDAVGRGLRRSIMLARDLRIPVREPAREPARPQSRSPANTNTNGAPARETPEPREPRETLAPERLPTHSPLESLTQIRQDLGLEQSPQNPSPPGRGLGEGGAASRNLLQGENPTHPAPNLRPPQTHAAPNTG